MIRANPTVLIVGKGPSARPVDRCDSRIVCALNGASKLCGWIDWLFLNDWSALKEISESCIAVTENVVVPSELHLDTAGKKTRSFDRLPDWIAEGPSLHIYELPSAKRKRPNVPRFGRILSVAETAVAWMLHLGYRRFETMGIDPDGGYHEAFSGGQQVRKPAEWYVHNWQRIVHRVEAKGGRIHQV